MSPEAFVQLLAAELGAAGVVVGSNYRFGYRAAGTAELLQQLGPQHGMQVQVLGLVASQQAELSTANGAAQHQARTNHQQRRHDEQPAAGNVLPATAARPTSSQQHAIGSDEAQAAVSSSRVRHALAEGNMADAAACLGRPYRLVASLAEVASSALPGGPALRLSAPALLNQPPQPGTYQVQALLVGADTREVLLPAWQGRLRLDEAGLTLQRGGELLTGRCLPLGAAHLALDFVC